MTTTLATSAGQLLGHYRGVAQGYDVTNARLTDYSGNGLHLPILSGAPAFAAYSGAVAMTMRGDCYFGCPVIDTVPVVPIPPRSTWIAVVWVNMTSSESFDFIAATFRDYALGDHAWRTPTTAFENSGAYGQSPRLQLRADGPVAFAGTGNFPVNAALTGGAWNVVQVVNDPDAMQYRIRVGQGSWLIVPISTINLAIPLLDDFRLGYRASPITSSGGHDVAMAQTMFFLGDPATENTTAYEALIAGLVGNPLL